MIDFRPVFHIVGLILCLLAGAMAIPAAVDLIAGHWEWQVFVLSGGVTLFFGLALVLGTRTTVRTLSVRQTYLATALGWIMPCLFAALPLAFGPAHLTTIDAIFEATSGLTTTGATVISGLDRMPPGLLLWRSLLNWMGGIGIIVMAVAVLPVLNIGGMQIFRIQVSSANDRATPRAARIGTTILSVYVGLTVALAAALWLAGMGRFDAIVHAMSTIATGGFGTYDTSLAHFDSAVVDAIVCIGMVVGGLPFLLFFLVAQGQLGRALRDQQLRWYLGLMALGATTVSLWLMIDRSYDPLTALRHGAFTVVTVMTGTGLTNMDYSDWGGLPAAILFFLTFVGGCAGSTAAGIKVFRLHLLFANARVQLRQLLRPHAVMIPTFNNKPISEEVLESVMGFLFVYVLGFAVLSMMLGFLGLDFITAISGAASAISNLGPGLGDTIGPGSTFAPLPDAAKVLLSAGMLFGRLEMFILLVLCVPGFWKQ
ncbi:MAG: TrkH family potassium uptake protein [Rhodospirillaceae bacterium]|nr:TrkH family potassium uptake protein [Rhodospirillales bacterium]